MHSLGRLIPALLTALVPVFLGIALAGGCVADDAADQSGNLSDVEWSDDTFCGYLETALIAGRTVPAGVVEVINTDAELALRITTSGHWKILSANVYAGLGPIPTTPGGVPMPALFPYHQDFTGAPVDETTFVIDLSDIGTACGDTVSLAVHAEVLRVVDGVVVGGRIAWALGEPFDGPRWAWTIPYEPCCTSGCTLTQGYWKNHEEHWPTDGLTIGYEAYTRAQLLALLRTPTRGDASLILGHQLIAALLNEAAGAGSPDFTAASEDGQAWMRTHADTDGRLPYGVAASTAAGTEGTGISDRLAHFNEGAGDLPHCDDGPAATPAADAP